MKIHVAVAGAGLSGAVITRELAESGKFRVSLFDEKQQVAGYCHTFRDEETNVLVHHYGPHIFHTDHEDIWNYINQWGRFEPFINRVKAYTKNGVFPFPINLLTINQFFNKKLTPREARDFLGSLGDQKIKTPHNFEDKILKVLGKDLYENFFYGYVKKLWGQEPSSLSPIAEEESLVRFSYEDRYYDKKFQGIPTCGYTEIVRRIVDHPDIELRMGQKLEPERKREFDHTFWSGPIDAYFKYLHGRLGYKTLKYESFIEAGDYQGNPIIEYCEEDIPFTRVIEHKHLAPWEKHEKSVCSKEYSKVCEEGDVPSYPLHFEQDKNLLKRYVALAEREKKMTFIGRLGTYRYLNMDQAVGESLDLAKTCLENDMSAWPHFSVHPFS